MPNAQLMTADRKLTGYGGHTLKVNGYCKIRSTYKPKSTTERSYVVNCKGPSILGFKACKALGLIKVVYAVNNDKEQHPIRPHSR